MRRSPPTSVSPGIGPSRDTTAALMHTTCGHRETGRGSQETGNCPFGSLAWTGEAKVTMRSGHSATSAFRAGSTRPWTWNNGWTRPIWSTSGRHSTRPATGSGSTDPRALCSATRASTATGWPTTRAAGRSCTSTRACGRRSTNPVSFTTVPRSRTGRTTSAAGGGKRSLRTAALDPVHERGPGGGRQHQPRAVRVHGVADRDDRGQVLRDLDALAAVARAIAALAPHGGNLGALAAIATALAPHGAGQVGMLTGHPAPPELDFRPGRPPPAQSGRPTGRYRAIRPAGGRKSLYSAVLRPHFPETGCRSGAPGTPRPGRRHQRTPASSTG